VSAPSPNPSQKPGLLRFGVFEADLESRELRKHGRRVRLQGQPFAILAVLLERPGAIVTREELRERLWPADTFVDFDHSLNTAINKIREVLGDSASSPRFVETVARRGYRFLADVQSGLQADVQSGVQSDVQGELRADIPSGANVPAAATMSTSADIRPEVIVHRGLVRALFALAQSMYFIFYVEALFHWRAVDRIEVFNIGAPLVPVIVIVTAAIGIPLRLYLLSAVGFDHQQLGAKFHKIFLGVLFLDLLWAIAPFLIVEKIGFGPAFGSTAALLYVPFAERTLVRMVYSHPGSKR
jgi:cholera toxin transcriptional activator